MISLDLPSELVTECRNLSRGIASDVNTFTSSRSTVSVERAILRLFGAKGVSELEVPNVNILVDRLEEKGFLTDGIALHLSNLSLLNNQPIDLIIDRLLKNEIEFEEISNVKECVHLVKVFAEEKWQKLSNRMKDRQELRKQLGEGNGHLAYVLTATGDAIEDVNHAEAVAEHGGNIIAVIRSTAQSLLDFVPEGITREGYGGTFATEANLQYMRDRMDEWSKKNGRYIRVSSFSSGLCMPEISAIGSIVGLDNLVNDSLYGVLYRDINMERTFVDQAFSRMINGAAGIVINTGEDNYLRTADPIDAAASVVVSQLINFEMARNAHVPKQQICVGNAFEISTEVENSLLYEWSSALLTRSMFPDSPVKYMPPTKNMNGDVYRTHACDTLFNLVTVATKQDIQTIGVPTEGIFTPHIQDRVHGLKSVNYVKTAAKGLSNEFKLNKDGLIFRYANETLGKALSLLRNIAADEKGLFGAIENGVFGDVHRSQSSGKGVDGVFKRSQHYINPFESIFKGEL